MVDILYPPKCFSCNVKVSFHGVLCESCWGKVEFIEKPCCLKCSIPLPASYLGGFCERCNRTKYSFDRNISVVRYEGMMKEIVHDFKFNDKTHLAKVMSRYMLMALGNFCHEKFDIVLPVPMHKTKLRKRRYNQAVLLAVNISKSLKIKIKTNVLRKTKETISQINYSRLERFQNLEQAFYIDNIKNIKNKSVLIVDDVMTTGATIDACAKALKSAGAAKVYSVTFARTY